MAQRSRRKYQKHFHRRTAPGAPPGTLVSDATSSQTQLHVLLFSRDKAQDLDLSRVEEIPSPGPGQLLWIDVVGTGDAHVLESLGKRFGLHSLALEDALHVHQLPKAEEYPGHLYIVARMLDSGAPNGSEQLSLFLTKNVVVVVQERPGDCFDSVRQRIRKSELIRTRGADYLTYALIDAVIDDYFPKLEAISARLDAIEDELHVARPREFLSQLHAIRQELIRVRKLLWQHREALNSLVRMENPLVAAETRVYFRDCLDHVMQLMDVAETDRESCLSLQDLFLSELSQRTNDVMKRLTLIATVFLPMNFIAALYGMNFDPGASPWNMPELRWYWGYPFALTLMACVSVGLTTYFWIRGWLEK